MKEKGFDIQKEAEKLLKIYYYFISELNMKEGK